MRVLCVSPHRDDETIGCGGTLSAHADRGDFVAVVHLCGTGGADESEARAAASVLGVSEIVSLSGDPVQVAPSRRLLLELVGAFRRFRPDVLYVPHADEDDPTHRVAAKLAHEARWVAAYAVYEEAGPPVSSPAREVYEYEVWTPLSDPAVHVDITAYADRKRRALRQYHSQIEETAWDEGSLGLNRYRGVTSGVGRYAEAFTVARASHIGRPPTDSLVRSREAGNASVSD
ncbi:hypothetical protein A6A29_38655 [Streptomyces sp. TSRI0281]|nr:hypothetical protein A6A29_38655 [Streptomyces sp. TSRI0281]